MRLLLVDDSSTMRAIVRRSLKSLGTIETVEAASADQGLELFRSGKFDLVLTDWNMPGRSGLELVREIRALDRDIPIVMMTTHAEKEHVVSAIEAGVSDYLLKPFPIEALEKKLWRFLAAT